MKTFIFKTTTTMKEYNRKKWWIDSDYIKDIIIESDTVEYAFLEYVNIVNNQCLCISKNAMKHLNPVYIDTKNGDIKQVGFTVTASCDFFDDTRRKWVKQFVDLWIEPLLVSCFEDIPQHVKHSIKRRFSE